jgi:hypothetical protein
MTAAIVLRRERAGLAGYLDHLRRLGLSERAMRDRTRIAREFQDRHPDLHAWMALPCQIGSPNSIAQVPGRLSAT